MQHNEQHEMTGLAMGCSFSCFAVEINDVAGEVNVFDAHIEEFKSETFISKNILTI